MHGVFARRVVVSHAQSSLHPAHAIDQMPAHGDEHQQGVIDAVDHQSRGLQRQRDKRMIV